MRYRHTLLGQLAPLIDEGLLRSIALADYGEKHAAEARLTYFAPWQRLTEQWLLGLTTFNLRHDLWQRATVQVLTKVTSMIPSQTDILLQTIVKFMTEMT